MPDKKRVLALQHIHENPAGRVGAILDEYEIGSGSREQEMGDVRTRRNGKEEPAW